MNSFTGGKVLITGGLGFIGFNLTHRLCSKLVEDLGDFSVKFEITCPRCCGEKDLVPFHFVYFRAKLSPSAGFRIPSKTHCVTARGVPMREGAILRMGWEKT